MMKELCTDRDGNNILVCEPAVIQYLTQSGTPIPDEMKALLSEELADQLNAPHTLHTENDSMFLLIRMMLLDDYILSLIRSKQPSTHYGTRFVTDPLTGERRYFDDPDSHSKLLIAVPYEGTNTPKGLSVFDNTEVAAITTMRYYTSTETSFDIDPHLNFLITQLQHESIPQDLIEHYLPAPRGQVDHPAVRDLRNLCSLLDQDELRKAKERFYQTYMLRPDLNFRKFFAMAVVAAQVKADGACAKSDRYEQGSVNDIVVGCSGTVGDTSSYFTRQAPDPAIDGMMSIGIMARSNNLDIEWLSPPDPHQDYLKETIRTLLDHTRTDTRAIADIAGICKSKDGTPETVIQELWTQLKRRPDFASIQGIIYYGKDNVKRLYRGPGVLAVPCTTQMELAALKEKKYFSFYKQKNCRGSDVKQAHGIHCLVTMDENVSNSDAKQTILRLRGMMDPTSGQTSLLPQCLSMETLSKQDAF